MREEPDRSLVGRGIAGRTIQGVAGVLLAIPLILVASRVRGATLSVLNTADAGLGSLRDTLETANAEGAAAIDLRGLTGRIELESPLPIITASIEVIGPDDGSLAISGQRHCRILSVAAGSTTTIHGVTLTDALGTNYGHGAAVSNAGSLTLRHCRITTNVDEGGWGAGIYNLGELVLLDCELSGNIARGEAGASSLRPAGAGGGAAGLGGAVFQESGSLWASNVLFMGNQVVGGDGGDALATNAPAAGGRGGGPNGGAGGAEYGLPGTGGFGSGGGGGTIVHQFPYPGNGGFGGGAGGVGAAREGGAYGAGGFGAGGTVATASGGGGGAAMGAALFALAGRVSVVDSVFQSNVATGGRGGDGGYGGGEGGSGLGSALFGFGAELVVQRCRFFENRAVGGAGGSIDGPMDSFRRWSDFGGGAGGAGILLLDGSLDLESCWAESNIVQSGTGSLTYHGEPAVSAEGAALTIRGGTGSVRMSTFNANQARGGDSIVRDLASSPSGSAAGGAVSITLGSLVLENCTLSGNRVAAGTVIVPSDDGTSGSVGVAWGGAVAVIGSGSDSPPELALRFCTIAVNQASPGSIVSSNSLPLRGEADAGDSRGGGCFASNGLLQLSGVIIAWNQARTDADLSGAVEVGVRNLVFDPGTASGLRPDDLTGVDPLLGHLEDHGGPNPTHALAPESPAVDAAEDGDGLALDERGLPRPEGGRFDLGAFELEQEDPAIEKWVIEGNTMRFQVRGAAESTWEVEFSTDLVAWESAGTVVDGAVYERLLTAGAGFYRARQVK